MGTLVVDEVGYGADLSLETFAASYDVSCSGRRATGDIRWQSTKPLFALGGGPAVDAGSVAVGTSTPAVQVTVENVGTGAVTLGSPSFSGAAAADWRVAASTCGGSLAVGASCTVSVAATPSGSSARAARLVIPDGTARSRREVVLTANGESLPSAPPGLRADRLVGAGVDWVDHADRLRRYALGRLPHLPHLSFRQCRPDEVARLPRVRGPGRLGGSGRLDLPRLGGDRGGESPLSAPVTPSVLDDVFIVSDTPGTGNALRASAVGVPDGKLLVPFPARSGQRVSAEGWALSPDGREVLTPATRPPRRVGSYGGRR